MIDGEAPKYLIRRTIPGWLGGGAIRAHVINNEERSAGKTSRTLQDTEKHRGFRQALFFGPLSTRQETTRQKTTRQENPRPDEL